MALAFSVTFEVALSFRLVVAFVADEGRTVRITLGGRRLKGNPGRCVNFRGSPILRPAYNCLLLCTEAVANGIWVMSACAGWSSLISRRWTSLPSVDARVVRREDVKSADREGANTEPHAPI